MQKKTTQLPLPDYATPIKLKLTYPWRHVSASARGLTDPLAIHREPNKTRPIVIINIPFFKLGQLRLGSSKSFQLKMP